MSGTNGSRVKVSSVSDPQFAHLAASVPSNCSLFYTELPSSKSVTIRAKDILYTLSFYPRGKVQPLCIPKDVPQDPSPPLCSLRTHHLRRLRLRSRPRVCNLGNQNIGRANLLQAIHNPSDRLLLDHDRHRNPSILLKLHNRRRPLSGGDLLRVIQLGPRNVIRAKHILLRGNDTTDAGLNLVDEFRVRVRVLGLDQDRGGLEDGRDGLEARGFHRFAGFCQASAHQFHSAE